MVFSKHTKLLAIILSISILALSLPLSSYAESIDSYVEPDITEGQNVASPKEESVCEIEDIVIEIEESRGKTSKTFHLSDGSNFMAIYNSDIHRQDGNGNWKDIDNRLKKIDGEIVNNDGTVVFADFAEEDRPIVIFTDKGKTISFFVSEKDYKAEGIINNRKTELDEKATELEKLTTLDNILSSVLYRDVFAGADIEYVLSGTDLKENIIINNKRDNYEFGFILSAEEIKAEKTEKGEIIISDSSSEEFLFRIPVPAMWDSAGAFSDNISVTFEKEEQGKYRITYAADSAWINDGERVFPIVLDPSLSTSSSSGITDLYVSRTFPNSTYDTSELYAGDYYKTYWKLNSLPELPSLAYIADAKFSMKYNYSDICDGYVGVFDVLTNWDNTLTWNKTIASSGIKGKAAANHTDACYVNMTYEGNGIYSTATDNVRTWNITPIVRKWYDGTNYGMMFTSASNAAFSGSAGFFSGNYSTASARPFLEITFIDQKGLEDYWTASTQDLGFAGTGYVNNSTGNLTVTIPTLTTTDALMPITPTLVYNFNLDYKAYKYPNVQSANKYSFTPLSFKLNINETLIYKSFTNSSGSQSYYYIYADSDGTEHYLYMDSGGTFRDEDGLLLTVSDSANTCTMTDSNHTVRSFERCNSIPSGVNDAYSLTSITDKSGNSLQFIKDSKDRPTEVRLKPYGQSYITQLKLLYNSAGVLYCVYNPTSGEGVVFRYANTYGGSVGTSYGNYLKHTVRVHGGTTDSQWLAFYNTNSNVSDGTVSVSCYSTYSYNYLGLMSKITNEQSQRRICYATYSSKRISSVIEYTTDAEVRGQKILFAYGDSNSTVKNSGTNDIYGDDDDLTTTYVFDSYARTVSAYTTDKNCTRIYYASFGQYSGKENIFSNNMLTSSVSDTQLSPNYLVNGGFEETGGGSLLYWSSSGNVVPSTEFAYKSRTSAKLISTPSSPSASISQTVSLPEGDYYLTLYLKSENIPDNAQVSVNITSSQNTSHSVNMLLPVSEFSSEGGFEFAGTGFSSSPASGSKETFIVTVSVNAATSSSASIFIDGIMLSKTTGAAEYSMVTSGSFENEYAGLDPDDVWLSEDGNPIDVVQSGTEIFGDVLLIDGYCGLPGRVYQTVYRASAEMKNGYDSGTYNDGEMPLSFTVSGWGKGYASYSDSSTFGIRIDVRYYDGTDNPAEDSFLFGFDRGTNEWQYLAGGFETDPSKGIVDTITLNILYKDNADSGMFDGISLIRDSKSFENAEYNSVGRPVKVRSGDTVAWIRYDSLNRPIKEITSKGAVTEYVYDARHRVISEISGRYSGRYDHVTDTVTGNINLLSETEYIYDSFGLVTNVKITDVQSNEDKYTQSSYTYYTSSGSHIFGTLKTETDSLGKTTSYIYDESKGWLSAVLYPDGNGLCYTYEPNGNISTVRLASDTPSGVGYYSASTDIVRYGTDNDTNRLQSIEVFPNSSGTGTKYKFGYDEFGNPTEISIGEGTGARHLVQYDYINSARSGDRNGKLSTVTYGNGLSEKYVYDELERVSEIQQKSGSSGTYQTVYRYTYDTNGNLFSVEDIPNSEITMYRYDSLGKLEGSFVYDSETHRIKYSSNVYYDEESRVSKVFSSDGQVTEYTYNTVSGNIESVVTDGGGITVAISPEYDNLGRKLSTETAFSDGTTSLWKNEAYNFQTYNGSESGRVSSYASEISVGGNTISSEEYYFTYDNVGNIISIEDANGVIQNSYCYDSFNRLTRENNRALGKTYVWTYDNAGNILTKNEYAFTMGEPGDIIDIVGCTYGDGLWKDLLTVYKNQVITYDSIGNPTNIGGMTYMSWHGRQLTGHLHMGTGSGTTTFKYNSDGIRTEKKDINYSTLNTTMHVYTLNGSQIYAENVSDNNGNYTLIYLYDESGSPIGYRYRDGSCAEGEFDLFVYEKNLFGDVTAIYSSNGTKLVSYVYDAWGNHTVTYLNGGASSPAQYNPFRYRSYYFDTETGLYYVSSRYYDPEVGRFISPDAVAILAATPMGLTDKNLYAYCDNNPVCRVDYGGYFWDTVFDIVSLCFSIADVVANPADPWAWAGLAGDIIDLVPFVTGVGEVTKTVGATVKVANALDNTVDTIKIVKAVDFTDDAIDTIRTLDKVGDATKSTAEAGRRIHNGYKTGYKLIEDMTKEAVKEKNRMDFLDDVHKIIYELKPNNPRGIRNGIRQLQRYNKAMGGGYTLILELY